MHAYIVIYTHLYTLKHAITRIYALCTQIVYSYVPTYIHKLIMHGYIPNAACKMSRNEH